MGRVKDILVYNNAGMSQRETAAAVKCSVGTVNTVLTRIRESGVQEPLLLKERELAAIVYPPEKGTERKRPEPDLVYIHQQMGRKGVTLTLLWEEYRAVHPDGLMLAQFCDRYYKFRKQNEVYFRRVYKAGERMQVDWAGKAMEYTEGRSEEKRKAYLFVSVLPSSSIVYSEPFRDMTEEAWIEAHLNAFEYYGGTPGILEPDNARTAVTKAGKYDCELNRSYEDMARYYHCAVVPARPRKPRDKAAVENSVLIVERRIIAPLRDREFHSFAELREAVREKLEEINNKPFQKMPGSRRSVFEENERGMLQPLPPSRYEYTQFKIAKVNFDYHVQYDGHYYSVPWQNTGKQAEIRVKSRIIEVFIDHDRVACHPRSYDPSVRYVTCDDHMPEKHRSVSGWSPERFLTWAAKTGPATGAYIRWLMGLRDHPEQAYKTCAAILRLAKTVPSERMEQAAKRAVGFNVYSYQAFEKLLRNLDMETPAAVNHENIRGGDYYRSLAEEAING